MRRFGLLLVAFLVSTSFPAAAQQEAGDSELQLQGSMSLGISGDLPDNASAFASYGRFWTDRQEAGLSVGASIVNDSDIMGVVGPFYRFNFLTGKTVPFVGAGAITTFGGSSDSNVQLSFEGGVRWFLERNIAFSLAANAGYDVDESDFSDQIQILLGFSYIWAK